MLIRALSYLKEHEQYLFRAYYADKCSNLVTIRRLLGKKDCFIDED